MKRIVYLLFALLIGFFFIAPLANLFFIPTWADYLSVFTNSNTLLAVKNTLLLSTAVGVGSLLLALPLSWLLTRTDLPYKKQLRSLFCLPYVIPAFVGAIGWIILANPTSGVMKSWFGLDLNIYSFFGLIWVEVSFLYALVLLSALTVLDQTDSALEEAARLSGASGLRVFLDVSLPLLKPTIIYGFVFAFLATASSFGVPALIGGPARIYLLTTQIYTFQRMGTENGTQMAVALSALLGLATVILLYTSQHLLRSTKNFTLSGKASRATQIPLKKFKMPLFTGLLVILFLILIMPILGLVLSAFSRVQGEWGWHALGFSNFNRVLFETEETVRAILQSFYLAFGTAFVCAAFAFIFNYFNFRAAHYHGRKILNIAVSLPFSLPGTVLALALIISFSRGLFGYGPSLYNTLTLMLIAYSLKYVSLGLKVIGEGYQQIHPSLEEAARLSGASWRHILFSIYAPILRPALIAAMFLIMMPVLSELTMSVLLTGPGLETIGTLIYQLQEYSDIGGGGAAVLSLLVVLFTIFLNYSLKYITNGRYGL